MGDLLCACNWVVPMTRRTGCHRRRRACAAFSLRLRCARTAFPSRIAPDQRRGHLPYQRPPLSKAYLKGTGGPDSLMFRPDKFYRDQKIDLIADRAGVDRPQRAQGCMLASGASLDYGHLVLATGARNRLLDIPNANLDRVRYLRILDESEALRHRIMPRASASS